MLRIGAGCLLGGCILLSLVEAQPPKPPPELWGRPWESDEYTVVERAWSTPAGTQHTLLFVPAGLFWAGGTPVRWGGVATEHVYLESFWIDQYEVSNQHYSVFLEAMGRKRRYSVTLWDEADQLFQPELPVVGVTWQDAVDYCGWAGLRLPTLLEWEKAARGTDGRFYPWGNEEPNPSLANYGKYAEFSFGAFAPASLDGFRYTAPVDAFPAGASPYGALNMIGNVSEYVQEHYHRDKPVKRSGYAPVYNSYAQTKGGDWLSPPSILSPARTGGATLPHGHKDVGFRCAGDADEGSNVEPSTWGRIKRQAVPSAP